MGIEHKHYAIKAQLEANVIRGAAAVLGNLDDGGDVILPGAFKGVLDPFLTDGFVAVGHDWDDLPVAMPVAAREQGNELFTEAIFHSTPRAQEARTVAQERLQHGKRVGLSIGYAIAPDGAHMFESGEDLLTWAKGADVNMDLLDQSGIKANGTWCRAISQFSDLFEYSIVPVPMNRLAQATEAKRLWEPPIADKGATSFTDMPMAARDRAWDSSAADKRVRAWAGAEDAPNAKYRRAFLWYDSANPDQFGAYKLQYADVIDGTLTMIPRAMFACAGVMQGARGGVDIPEADMPKVKAVIERWYARMRKEFDDDTMVAPWMSDGGMMSRICDQGFDHDQDETFPRLVDLASLHTERDLERCLRDAGMSREMSTRFLSFAKPILLQRDAGDDGTAVAETVTAPEGKADTDEQQGEPVAPEVEAEPEPAPVIAPQPRIRFGAGGRVIAYRI